MPCTAVDIAGHRVGMGSGYYDRWLASADRRVTLVVAMAYACQRIDGLITDARPDEICDAVIDDS